MVTWERYCILWRLVDPMIHEAQVEGTVYS